jgi:hypothetical protein
MTKARYEVFEALNPFFGVVLKGLQGLVDGKHYFDTFAEDALFDCSVAKSIRIGVSDRCRGLLWPVNLKAQTS